MSQYRDELDAAQRRIDTLEAKVAERDAALAAREAELREREAELGRVRREKGVAPKTPGTSPNPKVALVAIALGALLAMGVAMTAFLAMKPAPAPELGPEPVMVATAIPVVEPAIPVLPVEPTGPAPDVQKAIARVRPALRRCFDEELRQNPDAQAMVVVTFDIDASGKVSRVVVPRHNLSGSFEGCIAKTIRETTFPPPADGEMTINLPIVFSAAAK